MRQRRDARVRSLKINEHSEVRVAGYINGYGKPAVSVESGYVFLTLAQTRRLVKMITAAIVDAKSGKYR